MEEILKELVGNLDLGSLPSLVIWVLFVYIVVVKDIDKRFDGLSSYIRRFLALQKGRIAASKELSQQLAHLATLLSDYLARKE